MDNSQENRPLSARQRVKNLYDALADDALAEEFASPDLESLPAASEKFKRAVLMRLARNSSAVTPTQIFDALEKIPSATSASKDNLSPDTTKPHKEQPGNPKDQIRHPSDERVLADENSPRKKKDW